MGAADRLARLGLALLVALMFFSWLRTPWPEGGPPLADFSSGSDGFALRELRGVCFAVVETNLTNDIGKMWSFEFEGPEPEGVAAFMHTLGVTRPNAMLKLAMGTMPRRRIRRRTFMPNCHGRADLIHALRGATVGMRLARWTGLGRWDGLDLSMCPTAASFTGTEAERSLAGFLYGAAFGPWVPKNDPFNWTPRTPGVHCFRHLVVASGPTFPDLESTNFLRSLAAKQFPELKSELFPDASAYATELAKRCTRPRRGVRIAVFEDQLVTNPRRVHKIVQTKTPAPILLINASTATTLSDMIRLHNSYDILVGRASSHLAGLVLAGPRDKRAVLELAHVKLDSFSSGSQLGFKYGMSTGHRPFNPYVVKLLSNDTDCSALYARGGPRAALECTSVHFLPRTRMEVNLTLLEDDLGFMVSKLCARPNGGKGTKHQVPDGDGEVEPEVVDGPDPVDGEA